MTDPEQDLATILDALKATEPPSGLTHRIVENLAAHQAASAASPHRWLPSLSLPAYALGLRNRRILAPLTLAATLVLTLTIAFLHQHNPAPATSIVTTPNPSVARTGPASARPSIVVSSAATPPRDTPINTWLSFRGAAEEPPHFARTHGAQRRVTAPPANHLASFPAPPLPLTDQEKLLLRVAHAQNPQQSPVLNPALRASLTARDDENFQIFFAPATTIKPYEPAN